jgi:hypothetical protein
LSQILHVRDIVYCHPLGRLAVGSFVAEAIRKDVRETEAAWPVFVLVPIMELSGGQGRLWCHCDVQDTLCGCHCEELRGVGGSEVVAGEYKQFDLVEYKASWRSK